MTTRTFYQSRALRDGVAHAHQLALDKQKFNPLYNRLLATSRAQANLYLNRYGGTYDVKRTKKYLQAMTRSQLVGFHDGMGSATSASHFGIHEFARQNPGRNWHLTWHHGVGGARPRPDHLALDGVTTPIDIGFDVTPGMGAPGCACMVELTTPTPAADRPLTTRVLGGNSAPKWTKAHQQALQDDLKKMHDLIKKDTGLKSRWNGSIRVGKSAGEGVRSGRAAGTKEWSCSISVHDEWIKYSQQQRQLFDAHEMAHSFSAGLNSTSARLPAAHSIDEAVVEGYVHALLGSPKWMAYKPWVQTLEKFRRSAKMSKLDFYRDLLKTPVHQRVGWLSSHANRSFYDIENAFKPLSRSLAPARPAVQKVPTWADPDIDDALKKNKLTEAPVMEEMGVNEMMIGTVQYKGQTINVFSKYIDDLEEAASERMALWLDDLYDFGVKMPRLAVRGNNNIVSAAAPGRSPAAMNLFEEETLDLIKIKNLLASVPLDERRAMSFFDTLFANTDRHVGNFLLRQGAKQTELISIDHGYLFGQKTAGSVIDQTLTLLDRQLDDVQKAIVKAMLRDEDKIRAKWAEVFDGADTVRSARGIDVRLRYIDEIFDRLREFERTGRW